MRTHLLQPLKGTAITYCRLRTSRQTLLSKVTNTRYCTHGLARTTAECAPPHIPVMAEQVLDLFKPKNNQTFLDMTFGAGGHTKAILDRAPGARIFCLDRDPLAHETAQGLKEVHPNIYPLHGKFSIVHHLLSEHGLGGNSVDAVLFDVGASSMQFDNAERGFSLSRDGPLDMRMDRGSSDQVTAEDVINSLDENELYKIFKKYGEEKKARLIARSIIDSRYAYGRITTTKQLAEIVAEAFDGYARYDKLHRHAHVATKVFQALRIFVNNELNELHNGLMIAHHLLKPRGMCAVIAFHSLEDRIVKRHFQGIDIDAKTNMSLRDHNRFSKKIHNLEDMTQVNQNHWDVVAKAVLPTDEQIASNPRARSAKLRAAVKR